MDEVEIKNIGGRDGVASEVTLQRLLDATTQNSSNASAAARTRQRIQEASSKAQQANTSMLGKATTGVKGLTKEFVSGGTKVSDFSKHVLGASSRLQNLVEYLDDNVDQFRSLSQVGAGFNNSIFDMMKSAGMSAMRMDEYYRVVQDNSEVLRMLGGTVTQGAKEFGALSRSMRQGDLGDRLFDLGFTISDVNDGLVNYIQVQALQGRLQGMSQRELIAGSQNYLVEIDKLSKATGLSRDALMDQQTQLGNNAKFQSLLADASREGASNLQKNIGAMAQMLGPQFADDLSLIAGGEGGMSDLYKSLIASGQAGQDFAAILENAGNMTDEQFLGAIQQAGPEVAEALAQFSGGTQAGLQRGGSVLASLFDSIGAFRSMQNIDPEAATRQQTAQENVTDFLTSFGNQLQQVKTNVLDKIINSAFGESVTKLGESLGAALTSLFGSADGGEGETGAFGKLGAGIGSATSALVGPEGALTKFSNLITGEIEAFTAATSPDGGMKPIDYLRERAGELGTQLKNWFTDMFFGPINDEMGMSRSGGILATIAEGFSSLMENAKDKFISLAGFDSGEGSKTIYQQLIEKVFGPATEGQEDMNIFSRIIDETVTGIKNAFESESFQTKLDSIVDSMKPIMEAAFAKLMSALNETWLGFLIPDSSTLTSQEIIEDLTRRINTQATVLQSAQESTDPLAGYAIDGASDGLRNLVREFKKAGGDTSTLSVPDEFRRVGTLRATGRSFEPESTVTKINQGERVLNSTETASMKELPRAINQLNTLTAQVRDLMAQSVQFQEKTARGIRKLGSDAMA